MSGDAFASLLAELPGRQLPLSAYGKSYLERLAQNPSYLVSLYRHLAELALQVSGKAPGDLHVVDFGGGTGLFSLYLRMAGFGRITYLDNYAGIAQDARALGEFLGLAADAYIIGEEAALVEASRGAERKPQVLISTEVLEHIYDIQVHFAALQPLAGAWVLHSTTANARNPLRRRQLTPLHITDEFEGSEPDPFIRDADSLEPFSELRRQRIRSALEKAPRGWDAGLVEELVQRTRGLHFADIDAGMAAWIASGTLPPLPEHPTNTCDPRTGSWSERLLDPQAVRKDLLGMGLREVHIVRGRWHPSAARTKRWAGCVLDAAGALLPSPLALALAPSFILQAQLAK